MNGDETAKRSDENEIYTGFRNPASAFSTSTAHVL